MTRTARPATSALSRAQPASAAIAGAIVAGIACLTILGALNGPWLVASVGGAADVSGELASQRPVQQPAPTAIPTPKGALIDHPCINCIRSILATADAVWAGTLDAGIVRWDRATGARQRFTTADGLGSDGISHLVAEPTGRIWAVTQSTSTLFSQPLSFGLYDGARWTDFPAASAPITQRLQSIVADPNGGLWIADGSRTARFDGISWQMGHAIDGTDRGGALATVGDEVWLAHGQTVYQLNGTAWEERATFVAMTGTDRSATSLAVARDGTLYVGLSGGSGLARFDGTSWGVITVADGLASDQVSSLAVDGQGDVWVAHPASAAALSRFDGMRWHVVPTWDDPNLPNADIVAISPSPLRGLAVGGWSGGAAFYDGSTWSPLRDPSLPPAWVPLALGASPDGSLWTGFAFANGTNGVARRAAGTWQTWSRSDGMRPLDPIAVFPGAIAFASDATPWLGTFDQGLLTRSAGRWHSLTITDGLPSDAIRDVAVASDGRVWAATFDGLVRRDGQRWTAFSTADGLPSDEVAVIVAAPDGTMWAGTHLGAARFDGQRWTPITTADGLPSDWVQSIAVGPTGAVWFGTSGGIARLDADGWRRWTPAEGLPQTEYIFGIDVDPSGRAWAILRYGLDGGLVAIDDKGWSMLTKVDGLYRGELIDVAVTTDGHVWFSSFARLQEFIPDPIVLSPPTKVPTPLPTLAPPPNRPAVPSCTCSAARRALPAAVLADALANPARYAGWGERVNPNLPPSPANPLRECLDLRNPGTPFHALFNAPVWRGSCR